MRTLSQPAPQAPPAAARPVRILVVDDSAVMRALLRSVVGSDKRLEVAGTASDGASALRTIPTLRPDLILLDVEMPGMDGVSTLKAMRANGNRIPVIMCSALTQRGAKVTIEALACGAADYVAKPAGQPSREAAIATLAQDLVPKILALTAGVTGVPDAPPSPALSPASVWGPRPPSPFSGPAAGPPRSSTSSAWPAPPASRLPQPPSAPPSGGLLPGVAAQAASQTISAVPPAVLVIGVSTGGPAALDVLLPALPANFPIPVLIVQHMPELFTKLLAERLNGRCPLRVVEAAPDTPVRAGTIYIARGGWHMEMVSAERAGVRAAGTNPSPAGPILRLTQEPPENHCRPAVDVLFRSAVPLYGPRILAVVLTGMGYDGLVGSRLIRENGGTVLAQDQATSAVWGMPGAVSQAGLAQRILPLNAIAPEILRITARSQREAIELRESAV